MLASHTPIGRDAATRVNDLAGKARFSGTGAFSGRELTQISAEFEKVLAANQTDNRSNTGAILNDFLKGIEGNKTWLGAGSTKHPQLLRYFQNYLNPDQLREKYPTEVNVIDDSLNLESARLKHYDSLKK